MKSVKGFFDIHMGLDVCPPAKEKLFKKILPKLCVENDICPMCSAGLEILDFDARAIYVCSIKKCPACKAVFKGDKSYGRKNLKSAATI